MPSNPLVVWYFCLCRIFFCRVLDIRVSEGVRMNVGQIVFLTELVQPVSDAVRVHGRTVILGEKETGVLPNVCVTNFLPQLLCAVFLQNRNGFRRQADGPGLSGFGRPYINTLIFGVRACRIIIMPLSRPTQFHCKPINSPRRQPVSMRM